ncbi:unnamed protein product [Strongylus vulgaris]|uniref:Reverse transcriptase domain-containing protein n=1 Tax=Strongylus vulgaris TaxID=40348 RepID=A0A3P7ISC1_STRVU|nr:unnamed protein product [Strongylus vulgaris]
MPPMNKYLPSKLEKISHFPIPSVTNYNVAPEVDLTKFALSPCQKEHLNIINRHSKAFVGPAGHLGHYNGPIRHRILIKNAPIPTGKICRVSLKKRSEIEQQITHMRKDGLIRKSTSSFCRIFIYVDDLIITSETLEEYLVNIDEVLVKMNNCSFVLSKEGYDLIPRKPKPVTTIQLRKPTDVKTFLGICSFFRTFVHNIASNASPLTALTLKNKLLIWTPEYVTAMNCLKEALTPLSVAPRLGYFCHRNGQSGKAVASTLHRRSQMHHYRRPCTTRSAITSKRLN